MAAIVVNKEFVVDWVNREMREMESVHDESLDHKVQAYHDALMEYERSGNTARLIKLLDEEVGYAMMRLANPCDAMAAEFGREAVEIGQKSIELEIETLQDMLDFLRDAH